MSGTTRFALSSVDLPDGFRPVDGFGGSYIVNAAGEVRSRWRLDRALKHRVDRDGYHRVGLTVCGYKRDVRVHRLVAAAFVPNPESKPHVNHINRLKADNRAENLEWSTGSENAQHWRRLEGPTARDGFAAAALPAMLVRCPNREKAVEEAFRIADLCMIARTKGAS